MFEIFFSNKSKKFIEKCDKKLNARLRELFERLKENPVPAQLYDLRKIAGEKDTYRIRISSQRIVYSIYWDEKIIRIIKIEKRKESTYNF